MKQVDHLTGKANFDIRKRPINGKLFQNQKSIKDQFVLNPKKAMGKKYMQQHNIFKQKHDEPKKQHRQIVMSEQFIKSSKLYRLLRQKMDRCDSLFIKEVNSISEHKGKLKEEIVQIKSQNYQQKVSLWQLKNKLMQLKIILHEQEEENKRLAQQNYAQYEQEQQQEGENQMQMQNQTQQQNIEGDQNRQSLENGQQQNQNFPIFEKQNEALEFNKNSIVENQWKNMPFNKNSSEQRDWKNLGFNKNSREQIGWKNVQNRESKVEFRQILEQLMSLKAQRQKLELEKQNSSEQNVSKQQKLQKYDQDSESILQGRFGGQYLQKREQRQQKTQPTYQFKDNFSSTN